MIQWDAAAEHVADGDLARFMDGECSPEQEHDVRRHFHYGDGTNVLRLAPMTDWAPDTTYTVTVHPGAASTNGVELAEAVSVSFTTAAADDDAIPPCTDPTPYLDE